MPAHIHKAHQPVPGYPATHGSVRDYNNSQSAEGVPEVQPADNISRAGSGFSSIGVSVQSCPGFAGGKVL